MAAGAPPPGAACTLERKQHALQSQLQQLLSAQHSRGSCHDVGVHDAKLLGVAGNPQEVHAPRHAARLQQGSSSGRCVSGGGASRFKPAGEQLSALIIDGRPLAVPDSAAASTARALCFADNLLNMIEPAQEKSNGKPGSR
jgi:hypothetical protein